MRTALEFVILCSNYWLKLEVTACHKSVFLRCHPNPGESRPCPGVVIGPSSTYMFALADREMRYPLVGHSLPNNHGIQFHRTLVRNRRRSFPATTRPNHTFAAPRTFVSKTVSRRPAMLAAAGRRPLPLSCLAYKDSPRALAQAMKSGMLSLDEKLFFSRYMHRGEGASAWCQYNNARAALGHWCSGLGMLWTRSPWFLCSLLCPVWIPTVLH